MTIIRSSLLCRFNNVSFAFSTKIADNLEAPYHFNLSLSVGDDSNQVLANRSQFYESIGLAPSQIAFQKQVHEDTVTVINEPGYAGESDAMITSELRIGLAISTADCTPIFLYDAKNKIISGIHAGWRSTEKKITAKTIKILTERFNADLSLLYAYISPSISQINYEVGEEVAIQFDEKYLIKSKDKYLLDVAGCNYDMLVDAGIPQNNIQKSQLCTFGAKNLLHSYRREGVISGRALGVISLKGIN